MTQKFFQPYTTEVTVEGLKAARNSMRLKLWSGEMDVHTWLCHPGIACFDGCEVYADPARLALYQSELED